MNGLAEPLEAVLGRAPADWRPLIERWQASAEGRRLIDFVEARRQAGATIYPAAILHALERTPRDSVRAVILGQDPYHGPGQAEGLSFSVPAGVPLPPSLRNMLQELSRDLGIERRASGHLGGWADQGVLMLNTTLTVEDGQPAAHARRGWEALTDALVEAVAVDPAPKVFMLWGAHAQAKAALVEAAGGGRHCILKANHPSPLSARRPPVPFLGCGHFRQARDFLAAHRADTPRLDWSR